MPEPDAPRSLGHGLRMKADDTDTHVEILLDSTGKKMKIPKTAFHKRTEVGGSFPLGDIEGEEGKVVVTYAWALANGFIRDAPKVKG